MISIDEAIAHEKIDSEPCSILCTHTTNRNDCIECRAYHRQLVEWLEELKAIKNGGISDDVCEYRITDKMIYASCNNKQIASAFCWLNECGDYKYCPYCGKKIEVVE